MKKGSIHSLLAALVLVVAVQASGRAQVTDFSGTWVFEPSKSIGEPTVPRIFNTSGAKPTSPNLAIKQTPTEFSVGMGDAQLLYKLDGTEANISATGRAGFPVGKAMWDGGKLVIALTQEVFDATKGDYVKVAGKEVYRLDKGVLTVEKTQTLLDGTTQTRKLVYTKAKPSF